MIPKRPLTLLTHASLAAALTLAVTACGGDDDAADSTVAAAATSAAPTPTEAPASTAAPATTMDMAGETMPDTVPAETIPVTEVTSSPAAEGAAEFCAAEMEVEKATSNEADPTPQIEAASAAVPDDAADIWNAVLTAFQASGGTGESDEFQQAYSELVAWISDNCGYQTLSVSATEYAFGGVPEDVAAGPTIIDFHNLGTEYHEMIIVRRLEGVTDSAEDLAQLPEEELFTKIEYVGGASPTGPGTVQPALADLTPGSYIAMCFLPVGATEEMLQGLGPDSTMPPGTEQHFMKGMVAEFTVA